MLEYPRAVVIFLEWLAADRLARQETSLAVRFVFIHFMRSAAIGVAAKSCLSFDLGKSLRNAM
jgi:hypothetical protein